MPIMKPVFAHACVMLISGALLCACDPAGSTASTQAISASSTSATSASETSSLPASTSPTSPSQNLAKADLNVPVPSSPDVPPTLTKGVQKGLSYATSRQQLLASGWQPVVTPMCLANVAGGNHTDLCSKHPEFGQCHVCDELPELNSCSSDGYCTMQFRHHGTSEIMQITTYGDIDNWKDNPSRLMVTDFGFSKTPEK